MKKTFICKFPSGFGTMPDRPIILKVGWLNAEFCEAVWSYQIYINQQINISNN